MKGKALTILVSLALAGGAVAQDSNNAQSTDNKTRSEVDNQSNSTRNNQQSSNDQNVPTKDSSMSASSFDALDTNHRGYLTSKDVASNRKLSTNFATCDTNHDGRLSRDEYIACTNKM